MATQFMDRAAKKLKTAKFSYMRASSFFWSRRYERAIESLNNSIKAYHSIPLLPFAAYAFKARILYAKNQQKIAAHAKEEIRKMLGHPLDEPRRA